MAENLSEHPLLTYLVFVLPIVLLVIGIITQANLLLLMTVTAWIGVSFIILYIPVASDNGSPQ